MNSEFLNALDEIEKSKSISKDILLDAIDAALVSAYKRNYNTNHNNVIVNIDRESGEIKVYKQKEVVETVEDELAQISLDEAKSIGGTYEIGDVVNLEEKPADFGRIAAQTARQVILQKIHEAERDSTYSAFSDKEGELMTGIIRKIDDRNVYVELGDKKIEGVMPPQDRVPTERYAVGDTIKVFVKRVKNSGKNSQIVVSRTAPGLVKKLFEEQVPEIAQGIVEVKEVAREAGHRTKIAIASSDVRVDAVGACVGNRGSRVNAVVEELGGEKIDIILWDENPLAFIFKALSPATVNSVTLRGEKSAMAVVPDDKLSLAIGRDGQNARLAARLTGWKIDVKSASSPEAAEVLAEIENEEVVEE